MKKSISILGLLVFVTVFLVYCTKTDQVVASSSSNSSVLTSYHTSTAPTIDGQIDAIWNSATALQVTATVPDPGNGTFEGYIGKSYNVTLQSMYDANNIYILAQWNDPDQSLSNGPVSFNPTTKLWAKQSSGYAWDVNGVQTTIPFNEDKFGFQWNINNSIAAFAEQSCYATCHLNPATDSINNHVSPPVLVSIPARSGGNHFTNAANEKADLWHIHLMQDQVGLVGGYADDDYIDYAGGQLNANGRHSDGAVITSTTAGVPTYSTVPGSVTNTQSIAITGTATKVTVPAWVVPGQTNAYALVTTNIVAGAAVGSLTGVTATDGTVALLVAHVDANGVLTLSDSSKIDPNVNTGYQTTFDANGNITGVGTSAIPSIIRQAYQGSRGDIQFKAVYTGSGWIMELKRALNTHDANLQDVDFSPLTDVNFGIAVFNKANSAHAIKPGLTLHFQN